MPSPRPLRQVFRERLPRGEETHRAPGASRRRILLWAAAAGVVALAAAAVLALRSWGGPLPPFPPSGTPLVAPAFPVQELNLPVVYDMAPALVALDAAVPRSFGNLSQRVAHPSLTGVEYALEASRTPFEVEFAGDTLRVSTELTYRARGWVRTPFGTTLTGGCPEGNQPAPRARVVVSAPLDLAEDWSLQATPRIEEVAPLSAEARDRCRITAAQFDLTDWLLESARGELAAQLDGLNGALARVDLPGQMARYWELLREPFLLDEETWLVLDPVAVRQGRIDSGPGDEPSLTAELSLGVRPRIVLGPRPILARIPLPPLEEGEVADGFDVVLEGRVDYATLSGLAARELKGQTFQVGRRTVEVRDVTVAPGPEGRLAVALEVTGGFEGRVLLTGTPTLDATLGEITVPDLVLHVETGSLFVRAAAWVARNVFPSRVRQYARWPVAELLGQGLELADGGLNHAFSHEVRLEGAVRSLEVDQVLATGEGILVRSTLAGAARLMVEQVAEADVEN